MLTIEMISYWGTEDVNYPKVGALYRGKVTIGNVNPTRPTPVMAEVELPRNTKFALVNGDPNMKITCILDNFNKGGSQVLTGGLCPAAPKQPGTYEPYQLSEARVLDDQARRGDKRNFPDLLYLRAQGLGRHARGLTFQLGVGRGLGGDLGQARGRRQPPGHQRRWRGLGRVGRPQPADSTVSDPLGHQGNGYGRHHHGPPLLPFQRGTAYLDLGTATSYGRTDSLAIPGTHDALAVSDDWTDPKPDTTYHWRLRFVDRQGRTFVGADQTFRTAAAPADTTKPRVSRGWCPPRTRRG